MSYKDKYLKRSNVEGSSIKSQRIHDTKRVFDANFVNHPQYDEVRSANSEIRYELIIGDSTDTKDEKSFLAKLESPIALGDSVKWSDDVWMVTHHDKNMGSVYQKGKLTQCFDTINWLDEDGEIQKAWFAFKSFSLSGVGIEDGKFVSLANETREIIIENNEHTRKIAKTHRFIFDKRAWSVEKHFTANDGLIYLVLDEDEINPAVDNLELRIADYVLPMYEMTILNGNILEVKPNETLQINTIIKKDGVLVLNPQISYQVSDPSIATVDDTGLITGLVEGTTSVLVQYRDLVQQIQITVKAEDIYTVSIVDSATSNQFVIYRGRTKSFTCEFKLNGNVIDEEGTFWITADTTDNTTTIAAITTQGNNSCTVSGNAIGYCRLHVKNADGTLSTNVRIQVKSLI